MTTQEKASALLDFLARKDVSFGCYISCYFRNYGGNCDFTKSIQIKRIGNELLEGKYIEFNDSDPFSGEFVLVSIIGHPVTLQDVLAKNENCRFFFESGNCRSQTGFLLDRWNECGIQKSLNEIFSENLHNFGDIEQFEKETTQALFEFLWDIFEEDILSSTK